MGRTRIIFAVAFVALVGGIYFVKVHAAPEAAATASTGHKPESGRSGGGPGVAVVTAPAVTRDVADTRAAVGWVEPVASVAIRTRMDGVIVEQRVSDGTMVKAGDVLFRLDDSAIQASIAKDQAALAKDQANLDEANVELKRARELLSKAVDTQEQVDQQQAATKVLEATVGMDRAQIQADQVQLGYATITAPIDGRTGVVNVTNGNLVHAADQTPLVTITQMAPLRVSFSVPERDLDRYRTALSSPDPVPVTLSDSDGRQLAAGKLAFINSSVDTTAGAIMMKAEFANADGTLWPGQYVQVQVKLGETTGATVVPLVAIQQNDNGPYVFLVKLDHTVALQPVTVASTGADGAVVTSGVKPDDRVVVEGQLRLKDGSAIRETAPDSKPAEG